MQAFHGNLLLGGMALKGVDGMIDDEPDPEGHLGGEFMVDPIHENSLEVGRPYLLLTDDGKEIRVVVTNLNTAARRNGLVVRFDACQA
jgi:hypothetical protein